VFHIYEPDRRIENPRILEDVNDHGVLPSAFLDDGYEGDLEVRYRSVQFLWHRGTTEIDDDKPR